MKDKNLYSILVILAVAILVMQVISVVQVNNLASAGPAGKNTNNATGGVGHVTIRATGSASAPPTTGMLYISVTGKGGTAAAATANLSSALAQMNASLWSYVNHNSSLIQTTYYNAYNQTGSGYYPSDYAAYNGFVASEQIAVTIPNVKNVSGAIGALSLINGVQISSASATLSDAQTSALRSAAFSDALQNATSQASILAGNASLSTQNITVGYYNFYPIPYALGSGAVKAGGGAAVNPSFYSGTDSVTESITVVFSYTRK
jgi:uncharacterized protein YggE